MKVKCNECGYIGDESEFPKGRDFFQSKYVAGCPKCNNRQSPGGASMRTMPGQGHPFEYIRSEAISDDPLVQILHNAAEAS